MHSHDEFLRRPSTRAIVVLFILAVFALKIFFLPAADQSFLLPLVLVAAWLCRQLPLPPSFAAGTFTTAEASNYIEYRDTEYDDPGSDATGSDDTGSDDTGSDDTGSDDTGSDDTGSDDTGSDT